MATLEEITHGASVGGILPDGLVSIIDVRWIGAVAIEATYKDSVGRLGNELIYRDREPTLEIVETGSPWSFDGDGALFRLLSEANRIRLAYLFDPLLAVHSSLVDPLPHQITAVHSEMLPRQPLRFLLADDPGAGKTIMTGLFIKELQARGDLQRCLIVCPGNLVEQWQDELDRRFHLPFEIMTNDALESSRTGNWFNEASLAICRLDKLSRDEEAQAKIQQTDWDLIVIFTEHRDTLNYLTDKIRGLVGRPEAVFVIHGGVGREERRKAQEAFTHDKEVQILVATDAAGEGINLQRAHLMVNYDLPWNPNRLEQRFGRIHRIGQTEVCHLWNLVAAETREGEVYRRLLDKLDEERAALGGQVFDVLGQITFDDRPLRDLLLEAIRYGDRPDVKARLFEVVDKALDRTHLQELVEGRALAHDAMDVSKVRQIREEMERAEARRLQPHFIASFFIEAFKLLGGTIHEREAKRYEIKHVPAVIRNRDRQIGRDAAVRPSYERITFEKDLRNVAGKPPAAFVCSGHPLLDATLDLVIERYRDLLKRGAVLIDDTDDGVQIRALVYLEHSIQDARTDRAGNRRVVSKRLQFVEVDQAGQPKNAGPAPYLDYRPATEQELSALAKLPQPDWLRRDLEAKAQEHAAVYIVPQHLDELRRRKEEWIDKTRAAVQERLTKEINYWDHRAVQLKDQELAGKVNAKLNSGLARQRADELTARMQKRLAELEQERKLSPLPPVVLGGAMIVPAGLLKKLSGQDGTDKSSPPMFAHDTERSEMLAMNAVMKAERTLGNVPKDVSDQNLGYDIESSIPNTGRLRFIEVKGRIAAAKTVTVTKNEILTGLNKPDDFILAVCLIDGESVVVRYVRTPFEKEPDFKATSVNYDLDKLLAQAKEPA